MLTWQVDRLLRSGPLCAIATFIVPIALAVLVASLTEVDNILGLVLVASGLIFVGSVFGSVVTSGLGVLMFSTGAVLADISPVALMAVGIGLFITLQIHDLAGLLRRAPRMNPAIWKRTASTAAVVALLAIVLFAATYGVAKLARWQTIVVPFGVVAIGFAIKLAADSHFARAKQLR